MAARCRAPRRWLPGVFRRVPPLGWQRVRILIFHGYLLGGTGSNVYNARLAAALVALGHEVHLLCQDRHPERYEFVDCCGDWVGRSLSVRRLREPRHGSGSCTVYRPAIGSLLPVYVADRYEGFEARSFAQCSEAEVHGYIAANVAAVQEVAALAQAQLGLANHLVMGPVILARGLAEGGVPYAVKVHGSALEYTVKPEPERFLPYAREGIASARGVLVGSRHTAMSLWEALDDPSLGKRTRLGPPGVDVALFAPRSPERAREGVRALRERLSANAGGRARAGGVERPPATAGDAFARDDTAAARALGRIDPDHDRLVGFVGKLIVSKGVDLLVAAWPLVLARVPAARLLLVGFGAYRAGLEELLSALGRGDLKRARELALAGRALEGEPDPRPLTHLLAFLDSLDDGERQRYVEAAAALGERVVLSGRLDHAELAELLPACESVVVPSTFPEAFGMVAAEAAACAAFPISAAHSGLAEVTTELARAVPPEAAPLLSFAVDDLAVRALAERICAWLELDERLRARTREGLVATVRERWSWEGVARAVLAAAQGELDGLALP
jgi:glycosyltransferase involved in cell wall biosynthesis